MPCRLNHYALTLSEIAGSPPVLDVAHLGLVTRAEKIEMLARLRNADVSIPAGRISRNRALVLADRAAAAELQGDRMQARV
jgi:hypothetical protein